MKKYKINNILKSIFNFFAGIQRIVIRILYTTLIKVECCSHGKNLRVNFKSKVTRKTYLGNHVNFNGMKIEGQGKVEIGDYFHSGQECRIITSNHNYDTGNAIPYDDTYIHKDVLIGNFVWIGTRVLILGGVTIGDGAIIQAGSVVTTDIPSCAIAGGAPARVFKYRDQEHFYNLLKEGKYH